jgi:hypothetical protein
VRAAALVPSPSSSASKVPSPSSSKRALVSAIAGAQGLLVFDHTLA